MEHPNISYLQELSGGDIPFERKIIAILKEEFPEEKKVYYENFEGKNFKLAANSVHKLRHKINMLGLEKGYKTAEAFENNLRNDDITLSEEFDGILQNLTNYIERL